MKWVAVSLMLVWPWALRAQVLTKPAFEVASVKQNVSHGDDSGISADTPGRFVARNVPLRFLVLYAFQLMDHQLGGMPDWTFDEAYDVIGIYPSGGKPGDAEIRLMLQGLLAERFGLVMHHENRELAAFDLVPVQPDGKLGAQMRRSDSTCRDEASGVQPVCRSVATRTRFSGQARTMPQLSAVLQAMLGRPVVDKTGTKGRYDVELRWASMTLQADGLGSDGASLFTALREQAGLKLVSAKEPFEVTVVDRIQTPTAN